MNKNLGRVWSLLLLLFSACLPVEPAMVAPTTPSEQAGRTPALLFSPLPSPTREKPTQTPTPAPKPTLTPTLTPTASITPYLPPDQPDESIPICQSNGVPIPPPKGFGIDGVVVYQDADRKGLYSVGGTPLTYSTLPVSENQEYELFGFSPGGEWFAFSPTVYTEDKTIELPKIDLISSRGIVLENTYDIKVLKKTRNKQGCEDPIVVYASHPGWLNDHIIPIIVRGTRFNFCMTEAFLNPFLGKLEEDLITKLPGFRSTTVAGYSPDMSRVVYDVWRKKERGGSQTEIVLWDVTAKKEIVRHPSEYDLGEGSIYWSPDSTMVAYHIILGSRDSGTFLLSRDGKQFNKIRNISVTDPKTRKIYIDGFVWSPNSRYLAIRVQMVEEKSEYHGEKYLYDFVYIYDTLTDEYIFRCPIPDYTTYPAYTSYSYWIYWLPDNQQIILSQQFPVGDPVFLYDLASGQVIELVKNGVASGWSDKFPVQWPK
jgi:hypothetical protein